MDSASLPLGLPPAWGARISQKKLWFQCPPPLFRTAGGSVPAMLYQVLQRFIFIGCTRNGLIQIVNVCLMMLIVMYLHRQCVNMRFQRSRSVW